MFLGYCHSLLALRQNDDHIPFLSLNALLNLFHHTNTNEWLSTHVTNNINFNDVKLPTSNLTLFFWFYFYFILFFHVSCRVVEKKTSFLNILSNPNLNKINKF